MPKSLSDGRSLFENRGRGPQIETGGDGAEANGTPQLTPEQQAEVAKVNRTSGGVAAGRASFDARHPSAVRRREAQPLVDAIRKGVTGR